ncbi:MAG: tetratricopeptide repeat protein, partial [Bacteroidetes bacterium]
GDKEGIAHNSNEIGTIYKSQGEYQKALEYYQKSYQTNYQIGNKQGLAHVLANFGSVYANKKEYKTALEYYQQTLKMFEQIGDRKQTAITLNNIGNIYTKKGDYTKALEYYKKSLQTVQKQAEADKLLSQAREEKDKQKQDSLKALAEKIQEEANSLTEEGKIRKIQLAKEKEAKEVQQKIIYLILSGLLLMIFFAYFIYLSRQKEKKAKEFISQQKEEIQTTLELVETERAKSDKLLLNILPAETAAELKEVGSATPKHYKLVSVLFTDLKGFTKIAEKLSPQEVIENLNTCFLAFDEICDKYNLEKIKTIGDAYMCAGGLPLENKTNPVDIVLAGLEMQRWMADWKKEKQARGEETWELRLGIHSGEAIAGVVGKNKFAYDIWGDTVNLASRMESSGQVGMVNISETTYNLVKHKFQCKYRGAIHAKNKGEVDMYFVEGVL